MSILKDLEDVFPVKPIIYDGLDTSSLTKLNEQKIESVLSQKIYSNQTILKNAIDYYSC